MSDPRPSIRPRPRQVAAPALPLNAEGEAILARARDILRQATISEAERQVRLQVIRATLTGTVIRASDDYPEMRNPRYWTLVNDFFVVVPGESPVEAIADLWVPHHHDGVPIPRIRCLKYSSLILIQGLIQHFRETGDSEGLDALDRLIGDRVIPQELPVSGDNILWRRRLGGDHLLPGDQVWFDNPFFDKGRAIYQQRCCQEAVRDGKSPAEAQAAAEAAAEAMTAGEEGSNAFYLGDDLFTLGADSMIRPYRGLSPRLDADPAAGHELEFTPKMFTLNRFREHMIDDNFSALACLRANPDVVRPECFTIERVRSPLDPELLMLHDAIQQPGRSLGRLIDAMASRNRPPRLLPAGDASVPVFDPDYDWTEQQRVRTALESVMRANCNDTWWELRARASDDRYVLTASRDAETRNFTIGMLCADLVDMRLCLGVTSHLPLVPGKLPPDFRPESVFWHNEEQWERDRKPLHEMQAAVCRAAIDQWAAVTHTTPGRDGRSHVFTTDEKARFVAAMEREIAQRQRTGRAACEEVVVPWLPAPSGWDGFDSRRAQGTA